MVSYDQVVTQHIDILRGLQYDTGLFAASSKNVDTGYDKSWLRDNFYECLAFEVINDWGSVQKTYEALLKKELEEKLLIHYITFLILQNVLRIVL